MVRTFMIVGLVLLGAVGVLVVLALGSDQLALMRRYPGR